ncbi:ABC transporter substrate-binding protein [Microbacterium sp. zg.Y909]|uniref:ABC transporter substrate-binding protein n=1 Tax=Microbacterium sp. zg.Y909 TaxID=2969413 RepID=UPI00214B1453|nr:ABC transporter substrate-binding protein [Microbacterium sp. zg.Y909]MCR2824115.1 ABC transporter substrate-binding protein [Microbacterium sp. zg.Y909]
MNSRARGRRFGAILGGAVISAMMLAGCGGGGAAAPAPSASEETEVGEIQTGGTAKLTFLSEFGGFDPVRLVSVGTGIERAVAVMDSLLIRDERTDEVSGKLAAGMTTADDGKTWVLELREGVNFTDGTPLDAEAVIFNLERHIAPDSRSNAKALLAGMESMEATGPLEVTFTLAAPDGSFPLTFTGSTPAGMVGSPAALADPEAFNSNPVGAGPFKFDSWVKDDTLTLVRNDDYFVEGQPYLDEVIYQVRPDPQTRVDELISGNTDFSLVPANLWPRVSTTPTVKLHLAPTGGEALIPNAAEGPFQDERLREALLYLFDGKTSAQVLAGGTELWDGDTTCTPWAVGAPACDGVEPMNADLEKAKELVADYAAENGDPSVEYVHYATSRSAEFVQQQLASIGITAVMRAMDPTAHAVAQAAGDYQLLQGTTVSAGYPTVWTRLYEGGQNWGRVAHPELQAALLTARTAPTLEERSAAWKDVDEQIRENAVMVWYSPNLSGMAHSNKLHLGSEAREYDGSMLVYLDAAWKEQ